VSTPDTVTAQVGLVITAVGRLAELEGQDHELVIDMSQAMLGDVIGGQGLRPLAEYIRHYCDVAGSPADADRIAAEIETGSEENG
jgi:hypothetical protein